MENLQDATALRAALDVLAGPEHAQGHAVEHDDQHADVLEPRGAGAELRVRVAVKEPQVAPSATPQTPQGSQNLPIPCPAHQLGSEEQIPIPASGHRYQPLVYSRTPDRGAGPDTAPPPGSLNRGQAHHCCPAGTVPQMPTNCYGCHKGSLKDPLRGPARVPPVTPEDALTTATGKRDANFSPAQCLGPGDLQSYCEPG